MSGEEGGSPAQPRMAQAELPLDQELEVGAGLGGPWGVRGVPCPLDFWVWAEAGSIQGAPRCGCSGNRVRLLVQASQGRGWGRGHEVCPRTDRSGGRLLGDH